MLMKRCLCLVFGLGHPQPELHSHIRSTNSRDWKSFELQLRAPGLSRPAALSESVPRIYGHSPERSPGLFPLQRQLRHRLAQHQHACLLQRLLNSAIVSATCLMSERGRTCASASL